MFKAIAATFLCCLVGTSAQAGVMEVGVSANYRTSQIDENNFQDSVSYTGSIAYYFWEMSAIEISYTKGLSRLSVKPSLSEPKIIYRTEFEMIGADFVFTFATRQSMFQPFIKLGGAHLQRRIVREATSDGSLGAVEIPAPAGVVPSAGVGFKVLLTSTLSFKAGIDAWTSPLRADQNNKREDYTIDYAARAGISWMF